MRADLPKSREEIYKLALKFYGEGRYHSLFQKTGWDPRDAASEFYLKKSEEVLRRNYKTPQIILAMKNFLLDRHRSWKREPSPLNVEALGPTSDGTALQEDPLEFIPPKFPVLREAVRLMASLRPEKGKIDYGAVLLFTERVKVLVGLYTLDGQEVLDLPPQKQAEEIFPWSRTLQRRRPRKGNCTIQEAWEAIVSRLKERTNAPLRSKDIAEAFGCTINAFEQWKSRARRLAEQTFGRVRLRRVDPFWSDPHSEAQP